MPNQQPVIISTKGRQFSASAMAVLSFIVDDQERILMLSNPKRHALWEVVNGALEAEESILEGSLREIHEEAGPNIQVTPLGVIHAYTYPYDDNVQFLQCICSLFAYDGGEVIAGDDMEGSTVRWFTLEEILALDDDLLIPGSMPWLYERAIDVYRLAKNSPPNPLQPTFQSYR